MCGPKFAGTLLALLLIAALASIAAAQPPGSVPPQGTLVVAFGLSDGMVLLPAGLAVVSGIECGPAT